MSSETERAPGQLELVEAFVNTRDIETDHETLTSPAALREWLLGRGIRVDRKLDDGDLERTIAVREALRQTLLANNGEPLEGSAVETLRDAAREGLLRIDIDSGGQAALTPARGGVGDLFARLLAAVAGAQADGTWDRLKACPGNDCLWAFYDHSRNRSRIWCSMEVCGNRAKTRSYRTRRQGAGRSGRARRRRGALG